MLLQAVSCFIYLSVVCLSVRFVSCILIGPVVEGRESSVRVSNECRSFIFLEAPKYNSNGSILNIGKLNLFVSRYISTSNYQTLDNREKWRSCTRNYDDDEFSNSIDSWNIEFKYCPTKSMEFCLTVQHNYLSAP